GVDAARLHWAMTSISLYGAYPDPDGEYPAPRWGHPKDRRPDLKQIQAGLAVTADGGIPVFHHAYDGGAGEVAQVTGAMTALKKIAGPRTFLLAGDSQLVSDANAAAVGGRRWLPGRSASSCRWPPRGCRPGCSLSCRRGQAPQWTISPGGTQASPLPRGAPTGCWKTAGWTSAAPAKTIRRCTCAGSWCTPGE